MRRPIAVVGALGEARVRPVEGDEVQQPVAGEVEQLATLAEASARAARHQLERPEGTVAAVALVPPLPRLLGQHAGQPLAVEVHPLVSRPQPRRQVGQAVPVERPHGSDRPRCAVPERDRRHRLAHVARRGAVADETVLRRRHEQRRGPFPLRIAELKRLDEVRLAQLREPMEHEHPLAPPVGAHLESGPVCREGVGPDGPRPVPGRRGLDPAELVVGRDGGVERQLVVAPVAVVEDQLEQPVVAPLGGPRRVEAGDDVAVPDRGEVPLGGAHGGGAVALVGEPGVDAGVVVGRVRVPDAAAQIVVRLAEQPAEDARRVGGVDDAGVGVATVDRGHVLARDGAPIGVGGIGAVDPSLDAGEGALRARAVADDAIRAPILRVGHRLAPPVDHERPFRVQQEGGHQILGAGEHEHVGGALVVVERQSPIGLPGDRREPDAPAQPERAVARTRVVRQRERRLKARASGAGGQGDGEAAGSGGARDELLADPSDRAAAFGGRDRRRREQARAVHLVHGRPRS